jgi:hypothetical protein
MATLSVFSGSCHCGAIGFEFYASRQPEHWPVRACQCSFCRAHGARTTSDPAGFLIFRIADPAQLQRYRFGLRSADFLICRSCGVYLAAAVMTRRGRFATLNVHTIRDRIVLPESRPVSYDGESLGDRQTRREHRWTPVSASTDPT